MKLFEWAKRNTDALLTCGLFVGYLALLLGTAGSLGFMRDEGFYFAASRAYGAWFELLWHEPSQALSRETLDRFWSVNHEHPSLIKSLFALSNRFFGGVLGETSTSFRLPGMLLSSLAVATTFAWGRRRLGRAPALVAALSFAFMPRIFFHAHLACFDLPVCALWLVTSYLYARSLESTRWGYAFATGAAYGLLLDTKHNSWIFPFALLLHFGLTRAVPLLRDVRDRKAWWRQLPRAWPCILALGPALFYALWPWIWHDTAARLREYVAFHTGHEYYNMEFLGRTYWKPPMPRGYAWLMTLATVPLVTLVLAAIGGVAFSTGEGRGVWGEANEANEENAHETAGEVCRSDAVLWAVSILASYAPWFSTGTPIFGGTKHWMTAYPFLCLFAGLGFREVVDALRKWQPRVASPWLIGACVLLGPVVMTLHAHPFGLSAYTPLVGGAPGAASLGLNRTFWGYTTQGLAPFVNQSAPRDATVYVHDTALQSFAMFQEDGRLRADLRGSLNIAASQVALYQHEPHMSRVEQQIWLDYGTTAPDAVVAFDGVPIAWAYARKQRPR